MSWEKKSVDSSLVRELSNTYNIDLITASILARRGVTERSDIKFFLESDLLYLHNPFLFNDMEIAVDRILEAAEEGEKVRIFGDRDVDGMTSTVLMIEALQALGIDASWQLPEGDAPYGLTIDGVNLFHADDGTLIITVDCGISSNDEIAYASTLGIDTIIIDHHLSGDILPPALAIINPKIPGCGYPFADLAGCGVVAKVVWALRFSQTEMYKQELVLLHAEPGNDTVVIQAAKIENLIQVDRLTEEIVPGVLNLERSRLADFLLGVPIMTYNREQELRQMRLAFGSGVDIHLADLAPEIWNVFPQLKGKSLMRIMRSSRSLQYREGMLQELDAFISMFSAYCKAIYPGLSSEFTQILDLAAIGTIADLMPMRDENRIIVRNGMEQVNAGIRPSLAAFLSVQNLLGKKLSTTDIGWQVSPVFNAAGRLGVPGVAVDLLLSHDTDECGKYATKLVGLNRERKKLGENAWNRLFPKASKSLSEHNNKIIILSDKELNRGITGVMAARMVSFFHVPAVIIAHLDNKMIGSVRSNEILNVKDFLSQFDDLLIDYGGHPRAGGFSVEKHNLEVLLKRMYNAAGNLEKKSVDEVLSIDAEIPSRYMNPDLISIVESLEPYGEGHKPLQFLLRNAVLHEASIVGTSEVKHLKLLVGAGEYKWPAVFWKAGDRLGTAINRGDTVDMVFRLGRNYYRNSENLQLTVLDIAPAGLFGVDK